MIQHHMNTIIQRLDISLDDILPSLPDLDAILWGIFVVFGCLIGMAVGLWLMTKSVIVGLIVTGISLLIAIWYFGVI